MKYLSTVDETLDSSLICFQSPLQRCSCQGLAQFQIFQFPFVDTTACALFFILIAKRFALKGMPNTFSKRFLLCIAMGVKRKIQHSTTNVTCVKLIDSSLQEKKVPHFIFQRREKNSRLFTKNVSIKLESRTIL